MAALDVSVTAQAFDTSNSDAILVFTFINTEAFTPAGSSNYYYIVTLDETIGEVATSNTYVFTKTAPSEATQVAAQTKEMFTVDNAAGYTSSVSLTIKKLYYTASV